MLGSIDFKICNFLQIFRFGISAITKRVINLSFEPCFFFFCAFHILLLCGKANVSEWETMGAHIHVYIQSMARACVKDRSFLALRQSDNYLFSFHPSGQQGSVLTYISLHEILSVYCTLLHPAACDTGNMESRACWLTVVCLSSSSENRSFVLDLQQSSGEGRSVICIEALCPCYMQAVFWCIRLLFFTCSVKSSRFLC